MNAIDQAESVFLQVVDQVEFDDADLERSVTELLTQRPDALDERFGPMPEDDELRTAIAHALSLAGTLFIWSQDLDFLSEIRASGLFDDTEGRPLIRFKALALDSALDAGVVLSAEKPEFAMYLAAARVQVRRMVSLLPGCEDVDFWNSHISL